MRRGQVAVVELFAARRRRLEVIPRSAAGLRRGAVLVDRIVSLISRRLARGKPRGIGLGRLRRNFRRERRFMMADRFARGLLGEVRALVRLGRSEIARGRRRLPRGDGDFVGEIGGRLLAYVERRSDADRSYRQSRDPGRRMHIVRNYARDAHLCPCQPSILQGLTREAVSGSSCPVCKLCGARTNKKDSVWAYSRHEWGR